LDPPSFESFRQDIRYALQRSARRLASPSSPCLRWRSASAEHRIFSLIDAMRRTRLPYHDSERLVQLWGTCSG